MNVFVQNVLMKLLILKTPCICLDINLSHLSSWQKRVTPGVKRKKNTLFGTVFIGFRTSTLLLSLDCHSH